MAAKIRRDDEVIVLTGKDKGKEMVKIHPMWSDLRSF